MARAKKKSREDDLWEEYFRIQLTPEQKAEARERAAVELERARAAGVFEELLELRGKVKFDHSWEELRKLDDE